MNTVTVRLTKEQEESLALFVKSSPSLKMVFTITAKFDDGYEADIKVVGMDDGSEPWVDAVLFDENENRVQVLDVGELPIEGTYDFGTHSVTIEGSPWGFMAEGSPWGFMAQFNELTNATWENNEIQFPRLIAECWAVLTEEQFNELCTSMDLDSEELTSLFERADKAWQKAKNVTRE